MQLRHRLQPLDQRLGREWVELFDPDDLDTEVAGFVAGFHKIVSKLAGAEHQPPGFTFGRRAEIRQDPAEVSVAGEVREA